MIVGFNFNFEVLVPLFYFHFTQSNAMLFFFFFFRYLNFVLLPVGYLKKMPKVFLESANPIFFTIMYTKDITNDWDSHHLS